MASWAAGASARSSLGARATLLRGRAAAWRRPAHLGLAACVALLLTSGEPAVSVTVIAEAPSAAPEVLPLPAPAAPARAPRAAPTFPFLAGESPTRSVSVGSTSHGFLVNGRHLEPDATFGVVAAHAGRDLHYATEHLEGAIRYAAARLYQQTGTRLWIGNLARRGGGDISYSVSHNSGRDADLAFCYQDASGQPVDAPDLLRVTRHGLTADGRLRFDARRTWQVVQALLEYPESQVQFLFISRGLRELLLTEAERIGAPAWVRERAANLLVQPSGAAPHDDHLHVRVLCSRFDVSAGCENAGTTLPSSVLHHDARIEGRALARSLLDDGRAEQRANARARLALLGDVASLPAIALGLGDVDGEVRSSAARALADLRAAEYDNAIATRLDEETVFSASATMLEALSRLGTRTAGEHLARALTSTRWHALPLGAAALGPRLADALPALGALAEIHHAPLSLASWLPGTVALSADLLRAAVWHEEQDAAALDLGLRLIAMEEAGRSGRLETLQPLIHSLLDADPYRRAQAARALRHLTNFSFDVRWEDAGLRGASLHRAVEQWRMLARVRGDARRDVWLAAGFLAAGYEVKAIHLQHGWELVRAITGDDHVSFNARRTLATLTAHDPPADHWGKGPACLYWLRYLQARRSAFDLKKPPDETSRACYSVRD